MMKLIVFLSLSISATALAEYGLNTNNLKRKPAYHKCIHNVKKSCKIKSKYQASSLIKVCRLLVLHGHNVSQIQNSKNCARKVK
jgi:hypothetical protein